MWFFKKKSPNVETLKAKRDVNGLIKALSNEKDWRVRIAAADALGELGDPQAVQPLIDASAANVLTQIGDAEAVTNIVGSITQALMWIGSPAIEPLIAALENANTEVFATTALAMIGERAMEPLIAALKRGYEHDKTALSKASGVLVLIGEPAIKPLITALESGNLQERMFVGLTLAQIGEPAIRPLIDILDHTDMDTRSLAVLALAQIGEPAIGPLRAALHDEHKRLAATHALKRMGAL